MNVDYPLVSQTLPDLVDNEAQSGSSGPSSMSNFLTWFQNGLFEH